MKKIIVAIDGYSSSGKSTMAKVLARNIGYRYIDSGAMYRAVTLAALNKDLIAPDGTVDKKAIIDMLPSVNIDFAVKDAGQRTLLNGEDVEDAIRDMKVSSFVSQVAAIPEVRHHLVTLQQAFGKERGIVMDGRDIGTTVFPDAEMKVFVNAPAETRAHRRYLEMKEKGQDTSYKEVLANVKYRDHIDETRDESPLRKAPDAVELDNTGLSYDEQDQWLLDLYKSKAM